RQHQDSLLPRFAQGEEGHETTTQPSCLVCVDRFSHTVEITLSEPKTAGRDSLTSRHTGRCALSGSSTPAKQHRGGGRGPPPVGSGWGGLG
ncbi:DUF5431 family protein, partial [Escherichia coli]|uniref:DUF5431 family protein n=1 Tax=Escherichia coli TaxID=562 RepID=UPI0014859113